MTAQIHAPWTPEQVAALNRFQLRGGMHPFTCGADHAGPSPALVARADGWHCPGTYRAPCDYRQDWAHAFMADPNAWPKPFADLREAAATEATEPATITDPEWLRQQYAAAIWERQNPGRSYVDCEYRWKADAEADADAVMRVRDRHLAQLRQRLQLADATLGCPHAPQDGPQRPDVGAETPDGPGGRQAGAEPLARLRRLRDQLAAEHAKAVRADQQPRPDLDYLRVTAHNGIAAGLEIGLLFVDHHLREVGEQPARTTVNNAAASGNAADCTLRERYAAALSTLTVLGGAPPARLVPVIDWGAGKATRIADWQPLDTLLDALLAVRDRELEELRNQVKRLGEL